MRHPLICHNSALDHGLGLGLAQEFVTLAELRIVLGSGR
jgi:hypothetical protein